MTRFGVPGQNIDSLSYADGRLATVPAIQAPRRPTTSDKKYPMWCEWRVNKDALSPATEGEFWKLVRFESNGDATWVRLSDASSQPIDSVNVDFNTAPGTDPVLPDVDGLISILGNTVANATNASSPVAAHSRALNQFQVDVQVATTAAASPADDFDTGLSSYDQSQFTVDSNGFVQNIAPKGTVFGCSGLGLTYSAGVATIKGADGNDLSATNPGWVTITSNVTEGKLITVKLTANKTFDDSIGVASVFAGSLFGFNTGDVTTNKPASTGTATGVIFYLYALLDSTDSNLIFAAASRASITTTGTNIYDAASGSADNFIDLVTLESVTIANYQNVTNTLLCGSFRMDKTVGDDWTITDINNATYNMFIHDRLPGSAFPLGALGAAASSLFIDNGGTAPTLDGTSVVRYDEGERLSLIALDYYIVLSGSPSGAVAAQLIGPPKRARGQTPVTGVGFYETAAGLVSPILFRRNGSTTYFELYKMDGTSAKWTYDDMASGDLIYCDFTYRY